MRYYLGIDIGGTNIKAVLLHGSGTSSPRDGLEKQEVKLRTVLTPADRGTMEQTLRTLADELRVGKELAGIGVGVPGAVDHKTGVIHKAPNLPYLDGWRIAEAFELFSVPVAVDNDSRCFVLAESLWGAGVGYKHIVGLAIGTGIGGGIIIDGALYRGNHGTAGEFGHMIIAFDEKTPDASVRFEQLGAKAAYEKYGDRSVVIGIGVVNLINAFDPEIVVLGGGGIAGGGINIGVVQETAQRLIMNPEAKKTHIVAARLGEAAQAIGAGLLFQESRVDGNI